MFLQITDALARWTGLGNTDTVPQVLRIRRISARKLS